MGNDLALSAGAAVLLAVVTAGPAAAQDRINPFARALLEEHNAERDRVGVPRLRWSHELAQRAQGWAEELARRGRMEHASREQRQGAGENLWMGYAGYYDADAMVGMFVDEKRYYLHGTFPEVSRTGRWNDVGHYTQVIWRETQEVGCAVARGEHDDFLVCRYWPAGNTYGRVPY